MFFFSDFEGFWVRRLLFLQNPSKSLKKLLLRQKDDYTTGKVIQHLFNIDLYTYLSDISL